MHRYLQTGLAKKRALKGRKAETESCCFQRPLWSVGGAEGGAVAPDCLAFFDRLANKRDPQLLEKIAGELAVIVRHLMQRFTKPDDARELLQAQQSSEEALEIKRSADPLVDFCGYLTPLNTPTGLFIGNANIRPMNPRSYVYHPYRSFMKARGHQHPMSLTAFGLAVPQTLKEYEIELLKRKTKNGIQTSLELSEDCEADWLPRCDA